MKIHHGVCCPYTGGSHKIECYCGCADRDSCGVTRDADSGSRGADSSSCNADSGIGDNEGLTLVFFRVIGNI